MKGTKSDFRSRWNYNDETMRIYQKTNNACKRNFSSKKPVVKAGRRTK